MKHFFDRYFLVHCPKIAAVVLIAAFGMSCDVQSGMTKKSVEKFLPTPTPETKPTQTPEPIDPADILTVDSSIADGPMVSLNIIKEKRTAKCDKYNRVQLNGDGNTLTLNDGCQQVMINGDDNKVNAEASMEFVLNGKNNVVSYSKFANGKQPSIKDNGPGNQIEKVSNNKK